MFHPWKRIFSKGAKRALLALTLSLCALVSQTLTSPAEAANSQIPPIEKRLSVVSWGPGRLDVFVSKKIPDSTSSRVWIRSFENGWTDWSAIAVIPSNWGATAAIDAVSWGPGRIDLFMANNAQIDGNREAVWHKYLDINNGDQKWRPCGWFSCTNGSGEYLGGTPYEHFTHYGLQAVARGPGRVDIFSRLTQNLFDSSPILHKFWSNGAWSPSQTGWHQREGSTLSNQGYYVVATLHKQLEIFRSQDSYVEHRRFSGEINDFVTDWFSVHGGMSYDMPYAVSPPEGGPAELFVRGTDNGVYRSRYWGSHDGWYGLGTGNSQPRGDAVSAVSWSRNRVDVFETKSDYGPNNNPPPGTVFHKWLDGSTWGPSGQTGPWQNLGSVPFHFAPKAVSWGTGRIDLFGLGHDGVVYHKWTNDGSTWWPSPTDWESLGAPPNL